MPKRLQRPKQPLLRDVLAQVDALTQRVAALERQVKELAERPAVRLGKEHEQTVVVTPQPVWIPPMDTPLTRPIVNPFGDHP